MTRLSIAPVKSLALQHPEEITLERWGARGNREFYLIDEEGRLFGGAKHGPLVQVGAEFDAREGRLRLSFPDGATIDEPTALDTQTVETNFWGRTARGRVVDGPFSEALSNFAGRPLRLVRPDRPGDANDIWPVSLVTSASVEELARRAGRAEPLDSRRFRMLIEVGGCRPHEEDEWTGERVRVGGAVLGMPGPIPRCVVTTQDPATGIRDFPTLSEIRKYRGTPEQEIRFGVYGKVLEPGTIRLGDPVEPIEGPGSD